MNIHKPLFFFKTNLGAVEWKSLNNSGLPELNRYDNSLQKEIIYDTKKVYFLQDLFLQNIL